jgi:NAD(P)-dependent dehydrogenase (short-subunit alcohol dehydrogenase family)
VLDDALFACRRCPDHRDVARSGQNRPVERDFDGKVIIVTGAAGGIGAAAARQLGARGAHVVAADRQDCNDTVRAIESDGGTALAFTVDVTNVEGVHAMVQAAVDSFGRLDGAFNNAGVSHDLSAFHEADVDEWHRVIGVNLTGVFLCMREELAVLAPQGGGGSIVNTSSGAGVVASPMMAAYTAAKHGVLGITKVAAQEYARQGIRVNAILPGSTDTPMLRASMEASPFLADVIPKTTPTGKLGDAADVAAAAVWLLSDEARLVSGVSLVVDGGGICR